MTASIPQSRAANRNRPHAPGDLLPRDFYQRDAIVVARELLGKYLVHAIGEQERIGRIVEVEAYLGPHDLAAHTSKGLTPRTRAMFGPPGHAYVYLIYGMHHCMNVVCDQPGTGAAVLIRALEPVSGLALAANGPGRLCKAMGIDMGHYGADLCALPLTLRDAPALSARRIVKGPRIGVDYAGEWAGKPLRFHERDNPHVSRR